MDSSALVSLKLCIFFRLFLSFFSFSTLFLSFFCPFSAFFNSSPPFIALLYPFPPFLRLYLFIFFSCLVLIFISYPLIISLYSFYVLLCFTVSYISILCPYSFPFLYLYLPFILFVAFIMYQVRSYNFFCAFRLLIPLLTSIYSYSCLCVPVVVIILQMCLSLCSLLPECLDALQHVPRVPYHLLIYFPSLYGFRLSVYRRQYLL